MGKTAQDLSVGALGALTSMLTAVILVAFDEWLHFSFYSFTLWFVIPVGALASGASAASGYYIGSRWFNHRPTPLVLWNTLSFGAGTFFLIHYLEFNFLTVDGVRARDLISFADYLAAVFSNTSVEFMSMGGRIRQTIELGSLGYLYATLQVLGFCAGGVAVYLYLRSQPYCDGCGKYLVKKSTQVRFSHLPDEFGCLTQMLLRMFANGHFQSALYVHRFSMSGSSTNAALASIIEVKRCEQCDKHWLAFSVLKKVGDDWRQVRGLGYTTFVEEALSTDWEAEAKT
jgi:hypothetical protein